ncbi:MAG: Nif11-like leader peptide family natural product precursor [Cyanobacteriota bacterium]|nr:Nif11-like leader peptide family natural product precursor [Cyanobacteriota bacterium]
MSLSALRAFASSVTADDQLREKLHAATGLDDVVTIAAAHGHSVDKTVLLREHGKALATAQDHELAAINSWGDALLHAFGSSEEAVDKA